MTLLVDELFDGITFEQNYRIRKTHQVASVRPHIYKQGTIADGELVLQVYQGAGLLKEAVISAADINTNLTAAYAHGFIRFDFDALQINHDRKAEYTDYNIKLFMRNHTTDGNNFVAAVRGYERKFYETYGDGVVNGETINDFIEPLEFEIYEWRY